jgi:hypothetical protein
MEVISFQVEEADFVKDKLTGVQRQIQDQLGTAASRSEPLKQISVTVVQLEARITSSCPCRAHSGWHLLQCPAFAAST